MGVLADVEVGVGLEIPSETTVEVTMADVPPPSLTPPKLLLS